MATLRRQNIITGASRLSGEPTISSSPSRHKSSNLLIMRLLSSKTSSERINKNKKTIRKTTQICVIMMDSQGLSLSSRKCGSAAAVLANADLFILSTNPRVKKGGCRPSLSGHCLLCCDWVICAPPAFLPSGSCNVLLGGVLVCGCNACGVCAYICARVCFCMFCVCAAHQPSCCLCACGAHQHHSRSSFGWPVVDVHLGAECSQLVFLFVFRGNE